MTTDEELSGLKFLWKIENFNFLKDYTLSSPSFGPQLGYYLSITCQKDNIILYVPKYQASDGIYCSVACLDDDGAPLIWQTQQDVQQQSVHNLYTSYQTERYVIYIRKDFNLPNKTKFFPGGTLTVDFRMWRQSTDFFQPRTCHYARTRIEPLPKSIQAHFRVEIPFDFDFNPDWSVEHNVDFFNAETLTIKLRVIGQELFVDFTTSLFHICVKTQVAMLDGRGKTTEFANVIKESIGKGEKWEFGTNISKSMLLCYKNNFLLSNQLTLEFTFTFSGKVFTNKLVEEREFLNSIGTMDTASLQQASKSESFTAESESSQETKAQKDKNQAESSGTISQTVQELFSDGYLSDFNLKVGDRTFRVHKNILGMRSKVFRAMFDSEMKEMQDNYLDIKDFDGPTVQKMMEFVYSDRVDESMEYSEASRLYAAADFYALDPLKQGCSNIMKSALHMTNALGVLSLANLHEDQQLKSAALDFISLHGQDIIGTDDWIQFEKDNGSLALEALRELYLRKVNG